MLSHDEYYGTVSWGGKPHNEKNYSDEYELKIKKAPDFVKRTTQPMTTTSSVVGIKFNGGVAIAADVSGYYGKTLRFPTLDRVTKVNNQIAMASNGDYADFQYLKDIIEQRSISEDVLEDGYKMNAQSLYTWLTRIMYSRRSKFDPLWNSVVVAGYNDGKSFLGVVDKLGLAYEDSCVSTGMGNYLAVPLLRDELQKRGDNITKEDAVAILTKCLELLFYRDCQSSSLIRVATVTADGCEIGKDVEIKPNWEVAKKLLPNPPF